jgi:hypothetical protein
VLLELPPKRRTLISVVIHPSNLHLISFNETETCEAVDKPKADTFGVKEGASGGRESGSEQAPGSRVEESVNPGNEESIKPGNDSNADQAMGGEEDDDDGEEQEEEEEEEGAILGSASRGLVEEANRDSNIEEGTKVGEIAADIDSADVIDDDEGDNHQLSARTVYELVGKAKVELH